MKERKYVIYVNNKPIPVSKEIYREYWRLREQEKYLVKRARQTWIYLDHFLDGYNHNTLEYDLLDDKDPTRTYSEHQNNLDMLLDALKHLNKSEKHLIKALYFDDFTQKEYGELFGLTQQRISQIHEKIIKKLRRLMNL